MGNLPVNEVGRIFREGSGRAVAVLVRVFGDIDIAEDAVQDAFLVAMEKWPLEGFPQNPSAWIIKTGRNRAIDRLRRESLGRALLSDRVREQGEPFSEDPETWEPMHDDQLRLIFTCCHPSLASEAQIALTLRLVCGLTTKEVAQGFLVEESTMAQRIVRAKRKIRDAHIPYAVPGDKELPARLHQALGVVYLVYNAGIGRPDNGHNVKPDGESEDLCREAIRIARLLHSLLPNEQEVAGLLALLLLHESRREARFSRDGSLVLLRNQARCAWNQLLIQQGQNLLRECLRHDRPGPYQIQAAIQAVHADAYSMESTDWPQIVKLYDELLHMTGTPVVALNRAIAVSEVSGIAPALALIEGLDLEGYYLYHSTRGTFLRGLKRHSEAEQAFRRAAELAPTQAEKDHLEDQAEQARLGR